PVFSSTATFTMPLSRPFAVTCIPVPAAGFPFPIVYFLPEKGRTLSATKASSPVDRRCATTVFPLSSFTTSPAPDCCGDSSTRPLRAQELVLYTAMEEPLSAATAACSSFFESISALSAYDFLMAHCSFVFWLNGRVMLQSAPQVCSEYNMTCCQAF